MTAPPADRLALAEALRREGNPLALYDTAREAIEAGDANPRLRYLQVLALAQMGDTARAQGLYETHGLADWTGDEDAVALLGRLHKDQALAAAGEARRGRFARAAEAYQRAFEVRRGYFPAVNAASTAWAAGDAPTALARARSVLDHPQLNPSRSFFASAARAEALILLGRAAEAADALARALATGDVGYGERAATCRQLAWLCADLDMTAEDRRSIMDAVRPAPVVTYTGHMFVAGGAAEAELLGRIRAALGTLGSTIAYGALACGADILIAETILERGGELHVIMPFLTGPFIKCSVRPGGEAWVERFDACLRRAASVTFATRMDYVGNDGQFAYGAQLASGLARLRAGQLETRAVQLAVWDGGPGRGRSGAAADVEAGRAMGLETRVIDPGAVDRDFPRSGEGVSAILPHIPRAILFTDYQGYSQLPESAIPTFNRQVMGAVASVLNRHGEAVCGRNTWGDALFAVISDTISAAQIALEIIESLAGVSFLGPGQTDHEGMRIGLHFGPVYQDVDQVTGLDNFYGSEVTLTARIEPRAVCGQVYTTQAFAAILAVAAPERFACRYVGRVELAKGYGAAPIYQLERRAPGGM